MKTNYFKDAFYSEEVGNEQQHLLDYMTKGNPELTLFPLSPKRVQDYSKLVKPETDLIELNRQLTSYVKRTFKEIYVSKLSSGEKTVFLFNERGSEDFAVVKVEHNNFTNEIVEEINMTIKALVDSTRINLFVLNFPIKTDNTLRPIFGGITNLEIAKTNSISVYAPKESYEKDEFVAQHVVAGLITKCCASPNIRSYLTHIKCCPLTDNAMKNFKFASNCTRKETEATAEIFRIINAFLQGDNSTAENEDTTAGDSDVESVDEANVEVNKEVAETTETLEETVNIPSVEQNKETDEDSNSTAQPTTNTVESQPEEEIQLELVQTSENDTVQSEIPEENEVEQENLLHEAEELKDKAMKEAKQAKVAHELALKEMAVAKAEQEKAIHEAEEAKEAQKHAVEEVEELKAQLNQLKTQQEQLSELNTNLASQVRELSEQLNEKNKEYLLAIEQSTSKDTEIKELEDSREQYLAKIDELELRVTSLTEEFTKNTDNNETLKTAESKIMELQTQLEALNQSKENFENIIKEKNDKINELSTQANDYKDQLDLAVAEQARVQQNELLIALKSVENKLDIIKDIPDLLARTYYNKSNPTPSTSTHSEVTPTTASSLENTNIHEMSPTELSTVNTAIERIEQEKQSSNESDLSNDGLEDLPAEIFDINEEINFDNIF